MLGTMGEDWQELSQEYRDIFEKQHAGVEDYGVEPDLFIANGRKDQHVSDLLNRIFEMACNSGISDVHFEDAERDARIRMRSQGVLVDFMRIPKQVMRDIDAKIRNRSKLAASDIAVALDARFRLNYEVGAVDVRVSLSPTLFGTSIVCRVLDQRNAGRRLSEIHMTDEVREAIDLIVSEPTGLVLVTGPTGSGKTTTLYALLNELRSPKVKILTIEDPVEYVIPDLAQINITSQLTFAKALKGAMRQDPDIILVGEIRDAETAGIAMQAALTGHLVLSTVHTNDAPSTITRLTDLGLDPYTLGSALKAVLAQRLVRKLPAPAHFAQPDNDEKFWLSQHDIRAAHGGYGIPDPDLGDLRGYKGRLPVMELMMVTPAVRKAISRGNIGQVRKAAAHQPQYETLAQAAARMASEGLTSLTEARSITGSLSGASRKMGERLIEHGIITPNQLQQVVDQQNALRAAGKEIRLGELLVEMNFCTSEDIQSAIVD